MSKQRPTNLRPLPREHAEYTKRQLLIGDNLQVKRVLQEVVSHYRRGNVFTSEDRHSIEIIVVGLLNTKKSDEKVRRWCLIVLIYVGGPSCVDAVFNTLKEYYNEPRTVAAIVAVLMKIRNDGETLLQSSGLVDPKLAFLSALQVRDFEGRAKFRVSIDESQPHELMLGLLSVGLNTAPQHLFDPDHSNPSIVKELSRHDISEVSQYAVWAITENKSLSLDDLGLDLTEIDRFPDNVRSWVFRLIAEKPDFARNNLDYLEAGASDPDKESRINLALGLRDTYFDGIEGFVLDWFTNEDDIDVRTHIIDHLVLNSAKAVTYKGWCTTIFEDPNSSTLLRERMKARAARLPLFRELARLEVTEPTLFNVEQINMTKNFNFNSSLNAGNMNFGENAVEIKGDAIGSITNQMIIHEAVPPLQATLEILSPAKADIDVTDLQQVEDARLNPTREKVLAALDALKRIRDALGHVRDIKEGIAPYIQAIAGLL